MYYVVNTSDANWNQATVVAALTDGSLKADDLSGKSYFVESKQGNTASKSAGAVNSHPVSNAAFKDQSEYALAYIIFDTNAGKDYFLISGTQPATAYIPDTTEGTAASFGATSFTGGTGWTEVTGGSGDVPEPLPSASRPSTRQ